MAGMTLPETGPGSVAGIGSRIGAFLIDTALSIVLTLLIGFRPGEVGYGLSVLGFFLLIEFGFVSFAAQTPGMRGLGIAVVRFADRGRPKPGWVLVRTLLLAAVLPALIVDATGRAMHDRAAGTIMLRTR